MLLAFRSAVEWTADTFNAGGLAMSCQEFPRRFGLSAAGLGIGCVVRYKSLMQLPYAFWLRTIGNTAKVEA